MKQLAIFASGSGTNAENIIRYFKNNTDINVNLIITNNVNAGVIARAQTLGVKSVTVSKSDFNNKSYMLKLLTAESIDFVVLAGFLLLVPDFLINAFKNRIVNIHPALLPAYGGKGMYGDFVHQAVINNNDKVSGITIHFVNENYDDGQIIFQASCPVLPNDTSATLANRIHQLEYNHFPKIIEKVVSDIN